jgi:hypothetical protein
MNIQPIVEGEGEVGAIPVLLRRLQQEAEAYTFGINGPIRKPRSDFLDRARLAQAIKLARKQANCGAILVVVDGDGKDDCPKRDAPAIQDGAREAASPLPCEVVIPYREYEAWFLATIESLRGARGIRQDAVSHPEPELPRGAKGHLQDRLGPRRVYTPTTDQPALTAVFDLAIAHRRCRSFRRLVKAFGTLATALGAQLPTPWPPAGWAPEEVEP